jgi:hypothetical protein
LDSITGGSIPAQFAAIIESYFQTSQSPSFPNASIGNPGENGTGPPIKTFGGDAFGINSHRYLLIPH